MHDVVDGKKVVHYEACGQRVCATEVGGENESAILVGGRKGVGLKRRKFYVEDGKTVSLSVGGGKKGSVIVVCGKKQMLIKLEVKSEFHKQ